MKSILLYPFVLLTIIIGSYVSVHLLALLGIFVAFAYPIYWVLFPRKTPCIGCHAYPEAKICPLCREPVTKRDISPKSFGSTLKNALLVLVFSFLALSLVFVETKVLYYFGIPSTPKTVSIVIPPKGQYRLEEIFPMRIELLGITRPINAVQVDIKFDPRILKVREISTLDSFANIFIQKEIDNKQGFARITGGLPNPGYSFEKGLFATVFLQGLQPGIATIDYLPSSMILANDGRGTNVLKGLGSVNYLILPEKLSTDNDADQSIVFNTQVLGVRNDTKQLTFYEPQEPSILGTSTSEIPANKRNILDMLAEINDHILKFWLGAIRSLSSTGQ